MRIKLVRKFLTPIIIVALLATMVPLVSAYEAYTVNVRVQVKERFNCYKTIELASPGEVQSLIDQGLLPPGADPEQPYVDPDYPNEVPTFTCVVWLLKLTFCNVEDHDITDVTVKDNFSAEIAGLPALEGVPVNVIIREQTRGKSYKESFQSQTRILWYVTYRDGDVSNPDDVDNLGIMEPGECAYLYMYVWTKLNPAGKQSYTSPGNYTLNSGPTAKWLDPEGHQFSSEGESIEILAYD
ncbi:MAG TPA: hypothetical protein VMW37_05640 [Dehalococcoidales bacterium]|nr:hypothetical protein [Dehalococcoidales bacterium]